MKNIDIYISSKYDYSSDYGIWTYYLNYKKAVIKRCGNLKSTRNMSRLALIALYNALQHVHEPCSITIHSKISLGFDRPKRSVSRDIIIKIQQLINESGHVINLDISGDFNIVNIWEQVYGTPVKINEPYIEETRSSEEKFNHQENKNNKDYSHKPKSSNWKDMYEDLMSDTHSAWVTGSGGY